MPAVFEEQNLRFTFNDDWNVAKLDEHPFFRQRLMPLQLTGAVDFLGVYRNSGLYLIEVNDYRGSRIELKNVEKMCTGDTLFHQVGRKSKDSVACVIGAARRANEQLWTRCADMLCQRQSAVKVVHWLEFDLGVRGRGKSREWTERELKSEAAARERQLKERLQWLTNDVVVTNQVIHRGALPGVAVENIARAGQR